jgi:hypothetical protein
MIADTLRKIERELDSLALDASDEHPVDPFALKIIARRIAAQAEMMEEGIDQP